jgi:hypothetical protein
VQGTEERNTRTRQERGKEKGRGRIKGYNGELKLKEGGPKRQERRK